MAVKSTYVPGKQKSTDLPHRKRSLMIRRHEAALLVLDMQKYFFDPSSHAYIPAAPAIVPGVRELIETMREIGQPVIFTRHINDEKNSGNMSRWWRDIIKRESPLSELIDELDIGEDRVIEKTQYDAFYGTDLEMILRGGQMDDAPEARDKGRLQGAQPAITQVIICGVMTHLCCETTARSAFVRGFEVFFPADTTATYTERFHQATLLNLSHGFAMTVGKEEIIKMLRDR